MVFRAASTSPPVGGLVSHRRNGVDYMGPIDIGPRQCGWQGGQGIRAQPAAQGAQCRKDASSVNTMNFPAVSVQSSRLGYAGTDLTATATNGASTHAGVSPERACWERSSGSEKSLRGQHG